MRILLGDGRSAEIASIEDVDLDEQSVYFEGERLTEERAAAIARDIAVRHGLRGGRPRFAESTSRLGVRVTSELHDRLRTAARRAGVTESELVPEAISDYLSRAA